MAKYISETDPRIHWTTLTGAAIIVFGAIGAGWAVFQAQLSASTSALTTQLIFIQHQIDGERRASEKRDENLSHELERREIELKTKISAIDAELMARRSEFVGQKQYEEFHKAVENYMQLSYVTQKQFDAWKDERDKLITVIQQRLDRLENHSAK